MSRSPWSSGIALVLGAGLASAEPPQYESGHVHPVDRTGNRVLVVNTPDARLSVFTKTGGALSLTGEVRVGLEPVSVRVKDASTAWVVNHLSDNISVVDLDLGTVVHSIPTGDEPTDVAFVLDPVDDDGSLWAVICVSQEDKLVVVDADPPYTRKAEVDLPTADPHALAVNRDRDGVWVCAFESANRTTLVPRGEVGRSQGPWGGGPPPYDPPLNPDLPDTLLPLNGLIVEQVAGEWYDEMGGNWSSFIDWGVMDNDLLFLNLARPTPSLGPVVSNVGTNLYDVAVDPDTDEVWSIHLDAFNRTRFEPKLVGEAVRNRAGKASASGTGYQEFELNGHIAFGAPGAPSAPSAPWLRALSLAIPTEVAFIRNGSQKEIVVSGMGSGTLVVLDPASGATRRRLPAPEGITGIVQFGPPDVRLVLVDRFRNEIHVLDPLNGFVSQTLPIGMSGWDPTPADVKAGRRFLYTAEESSHGTFACASCHPYAGMDGIAWNLGDPSGEMLRISFPDQIPPGTFDFFPLKGPMVTQSLRGLKDQMPLHWRGDREDFTQFNGAFQGLLGGSELSPAEMASFETFILSVNYPPNPFRDLEDNPLPVIQTGDPLAGQDVFDEFCTPCHTTPMGKGPVMFLDRLTGRQSFVPQQLRGLYEKTGMDDIDGIPDPLNGTANKRAFGYTHDGMNRNLLEFAQRLFPLDPPEHVDLRAFLLAFPTETDAAVGAEATLNAAALADGVTAPRIDRLQAAAEAGRVDLVARALADGEPRGYLWVDTAGGGTYRTDRSTGTVTRSQLVSLVSVQGAAVTFTAVAPGDGIRSGIDRDLDGHFDRDELDARSDPADPASTPLTVDVPKPHRSGRALTRVTSVFPTPFRDRTRVELYLAQPGPARLDVFDARGRRVRRLFEGDLPAGATTVAWDGRDDLGRDAAGGAYFMRLETPTATDSRKVIRLR